MSGTGFVLVIWLVADSLVALPRSYASREACERAAHEWVNTQSGMGLTRKYACIPGG